MRAILGAVMLAMSAPECDPTSLDGAEIRPGDGGVWVDKGDASEFFPTESIMVDFKNRPLPPDEILCMLVVGDLNEQNEYPKWQGIWIEDVKQPWFLGPVEPGADSRDQESAQLRYTYCDPTSNIPGCMDTISLILRFETIVAVKNPVESLEPWSQAYFLNGITAMGMDRVQMLTGSKAPTCWDWKYRETPEYHVAPCADCKALGVDFTWCNSANSGDDPRDCFRRE